MHQAKKGNQYYFCMKAHIGVDDKSGLVHSVVGTAANVAGVTQVEKLLHGDENLVCTDAGYTGIEKRLDHEGRKFSSVEGWVCGVLTHKHHPQAKGWRVCRTLSEPHEKSLRGEVAPGSRSMLSVVAF